MTHIARHTRTSSITRSLNDTKLADRHKAGEAADTTTDKTPGKVPGATGANKAVGDNGAQAAGTRWMQPGGVNPDANDNLPRDAGDINARGEDGR